MITRTYIFCHDDPRGFTDEVRKFFSEADKCRVISFQTSEELMGLIEKNKERKFSRITIIGVHDTQDHFQTIDKLTIEIKKIDTFNELVLICPPEKMNEIKKSVRFNIGAFIPKNSNSTIRLQNTLKKLISARNVVILRNRRNRSLYLLFAFLFASALTLVILYFLLPWYF
jgi:hypothetical protein